MQNRSGLFLSFLLLTQTSLFAAETIVTKRLKSINRLLYPTKITVGPDDQYHGAVDGTGMIYTKKSDLVPHLCRLDFATGTETELLPRAADSEEAAISPKGMLAFIYYKYNALGDVCFRQLDTKVQNDTQVQAQAFDQGVTCLKTVEGERSTPFWKAERELGYRVRDRKTGVAKILVDNIDSGARKILAEGDVWSPAMAPGGKYLFYNEMRPTGTDTAEGNRQGLVIKDLNTNKTNSVRFLLPGMSGFPAVSSDESYLYVSQYFNDSNGDGVIDGKDNSVVVRVPTSKLWSTNPVFPAQLTSAESNCSFPRPYKEDLYTTCAFEGSLDIYRIPTTGIVPADWNQAFLNNAHQTSRTYQERILILNTLRYRFPQSDNLAMQEKLLGNYLASEDTSAAKYYIRVLQSGVYAKTGSAVGKDFWDLLYRYLGAVELKKAQTSDEVSRAFQNEIMAIDAALEKGKGNDRFRTILRGMLRTFINQPKEAAKFAKEVHFPPFAKKADAVSVHPLERYYYFDLYSSILPPKAVNQQWVDLYLQMMKAPEITAESRLYYAFRFLTQMGQLKMSAKERFDVVSPLEFEVEDPVRTLIKSELSSLKLILTADEPGKQKEYRILDGLMNTSRNDYFLRKAVYIRSILNFADAADFQHLIFVANAWLRYTAPSDTEYNSARDIFIQASLDRGYEYFGIKNYNVASGYFYGAVTLTDDLEAHYNYIDSMVLNRQRDLIDLRYQGLISQQFVDDNMKFVRALLILIDAKPDSAKDTDALDKALDLLGQMEQDRTSGMRYLLVGYCYMEKLLRTAEAYDFDRKSYEEAHRSLMLAYDQSKDNVRIRASALMNLGILHQRVQNQGLAVKFFAMRKLMGFVSPGERVGFAWLYARSLFYMEQPDHSSQELQEVLNLTDTKTATIPPIQRLPLLERIAFYQQAAGDYEAAFSSYAEILSSKPSLTDLNFAKLYLSYGHVLFKLKKESEAQGALKSSLAYLSRLQDIKKGEERLVDFRPLRLKLNAYGLLGQIGAPAEKVAALENRRQLLLQSGGLYPDNASLSVQVRLQLAQLYAATDHPARAVTAMREAIALTKKLGEAGGFLSRTVFEASRGYLTHSVMHPEYYQKEDPSTIQYVVDQTFRAYQQQKGARQPYLDLQQAKLKLLWTAYGEKVLKGPRPNSQAIAEIIQSAVKSAPAGSTELHGLAAALGYSNLPEAE